jgi:hypothetical protein
VRQITAVAGGVSGITSASPALAVASRSGDVAFSVYRNGQYEIYSLDAARASGGVVVQMAGGEEAGAPREEGALAHVLEDPSFGLPSGQDFSIAPYDNRLRLETLAQPYIGASTSGDLGGLIRASFGFVLGDTLRERQFQLLARAGTTRDDFAAQFAYTTRIGQWNWGVAGGAAPSRFVGARRALFRDGTSVRRELTHLRFENQWASLTSRYDVDRSRRFEFRVGLRRTGYEWQMQTRVVNATNGDTTSRSSADLPAGAPIYLAEGEAAFVHDTAVMGATGPVLGQRMRFDVAPAVGGLAYVTVRADVRRYFLPVRPVTIALRLQHAGRYGPGSSDPRLTPILLGLQTLVRGYDIATYAADECGRSATSCSLVDELAGSRMEVANLELRAPLMGLLSGELDYGKVPVDLIAFADAGFLSTRRAGTRTDHDRFRSIGAGARVNMGGIVLEVAAARPFDRVRNGWTASLLLRPGF